MERVVLEVFIRREESNDIEETEFRSSTHMLCLIYMLSDCMDYYPLI